MKIGTAWSAFCLAFLLAASPALAAPAVEWTSAVPGEDDQLVRDVLAVADGYVAAGIALRQPGNPVSGGSMQCTLAKTGLDGTPLWLRTYSFTLMSACFGVAPAGDGGFALVGTFFRWSNHHDGKIVVIRTDADGNQRWVRFHDANDLYGVSTTQGYDIEATVDGGFIVLAQLNPIDLPDSPIMLLKLDANGDELWRSFPGDSYAEAYQVEQTADGGFAIAGWRFAGAPGDELRSPAYRAYLVRVDDAGQRVWAREYPLQEGSMGTAVRQTPDGGFALAGYTGPFGGTDALDALLIRVDAEGDMLWLRTFGGPGDDVAQDLSIAPGGGIVVTGSRGTPEGDEVQTDKLFLRKFTAEGGPSWEILLNGAPGGESGWASGEAIAPTADGGVIVAGGLRTSNEGSTYGSDADAWFVKVGPVDSAAIGVEIDVKPGSAENPVNLKAQGTVPVAILTTDSFDAAAVDPATVSFAGAPVAAHPNGALQCSLEDVDGDGDEDLLLHFAIPALQLAAGDGEATLDGGTYQGPDVTGTGSVRVTGAAK